MKRYKATCAYDGTDLFGWQSQQGGNTIQDFIEKRLQEIFKKPIRIHSSGRTDAGVHAKGQVFHFEGDWPHATKALLRALRTGMPSSILITSLKPVSKDFHARYSVKGKRYAYCLYLGTALPTKQRYTWSLYRKDLDIEAMRKAAKKLLGKHNFFAFSRATGDHKKIDPVKTLHRLDVIKRGSHLRIVTEGSGYLYKMVRSIVGTLVEVGLHKLVPKEVEAILNAKKRSAKTPSAPAEGLCLEKVFY